MPELPEVETIRRQLHRALAGGTILGLETIRDGILTIPGGPALESLIGSRITGVSRRGKLLLVETGNALLLVLHLKMTGQPALLRDRKPGKHTQFIIGGKDRRGNEFYFHFNDLRRFGRAWLLPSAAPEKHYPLSQVGADALGVSLKEFTAALAGSRRPLKPLLLDQTKVAGIGNIYADEILHRGRLHPLMPFCSLDPLHVRRLYRAMGRVLQRAIERGGSSVRDYIQADGRRGSFQEEHAVYRRHGRKCPRCSAVIRRIVLGGRGTHYCPSCQPAPKKNRTSP